MKKIFKILIMIIAGTTINSCHAQIADFQGKWKNSSSDMDEFVLNLNQNNSTLTGSHISVQMNGNKVDSTLDDADISINGNVDSKTQVLVTFTSAFSNTSGTATITKISQTEIDWEIIRLPSGEFYIPKKMRLYKE